jgi:hypothetical protein
MTKIIKDAERVTILDQRYYKWFDSYYPSVTTVLRMWSPEPHLIEWFKNNGRNADIILRESAERGTLVHNMAEKLLMGDYLAYEDVNDIQAWEMVLKFSEFVIENDVKPESVELQMACPTNKVGGTLDLVCIIDGVRWLIDFKTSNYLQDTYFIQGAIYKDMYERMTGENIDKVGVLWLNAKTRGADRTGKKIQGRGWQLVESPDSQESLMEDWRHLKAIYDRRYPVPNPNEKEFPARIKLLRQHTLAANNIK